MVVTGEGGHERDTNHWLIDKSALARLGRSVQAGEWALRIERGLVRITTVTLLEVGNKDFEVIAEITGQPVERLAVSGM